MAANDVPDLLVELAKRPEKLSALRLWRTLSLEERIAAAKALLEAWKTVPGPVPLAYCLVGGSPIPPELIQDLEESMDLVVVEGYGLTETSPVCAFRTPEMLRKSGSVGRAAGFAKLALLGPTDQIFPTGEGAEHS